jgi:hypothetical protein
MRTFSSAITASSFSLRKILFAVKIAVLPSPAILPVFTNDMLVSRIKLFFIAGAASHQQIHLNVSRLHHHQHPSFN